MDLLSSIRKSGSRGGVNFSWDDVSTSQHRENYLGHSLMAPVGRWQKGKDLNWYAKADDDASSNETAEEKRVRERKEEIKRIKEAEEDALARALGLPVAQRNGEGTGANNIDVGEMRRVIKETEDGDDEINEVGNSKGFGDFVGKMDVDTIEQSIEQPEQGGLLRKSDDGERSRKRRERGRDDRSRSRSRDRRHRRHRHRSRSGERHKHRRREEDQAERRVRSRSGERRDRRHRSRSTDQFRSRKDDWESRRNHDRRPRRSRSPDARDRGREGGRR